jgi:hypothetical protein
MAKLDETLKPASPITGIKDITPVNTSTLPADLMADLTADVGLGVSFKPEDQLLPLIYVLQSNSPSTQERDPAYIQGAKPGHFWLRGALNPIRDGLTGIEVIPCEMVRSWIEWLPKRQGFVARHDAPPEDMVDRKMRDEDGRERTIWVRSGSGNTIQDTREFYLLCDGEPYVLPCTGTKHTFARKWQSLFHKFKHPQTKQVLSAFARKYRLTTEPAQNAVGKWFALKYQDLGFVTKAEYDEAKAFFNAVKRGEKQAEAPKADGEDENVPF